MKQGIYKGYNAGCGNGFDVWGLSSNMPSWLSSPLNTSSLPLEPPNYRVAAQNNVQTGISNYQFHPDLFPTIVNSQWVIYAAMIPGTYPGPQGDDNPRPRSSKEDGTWSVALGSPIRHRKLQDDYHVIEALKSAYGSRAIYLDGQQTWVTYRMSGESYDDLGILIGEGYANGGGDHYVINIANQTVEKYKVQYITEHFFNSDWPFDMTEMEIWFTAGLYPSPMGDTLRWQPNVIGSPNGGIVDKVQPACNDISFGKDYFVISTYRPYTSVIYPYKPRWSVGRIKYDGTRINNAGETSAGMEVFCTYPGIDFLGNWNEHLGDYENPNDYVGDYWIVMPSCRVYLDSSASAVDEPWVCAIHKENGNRRIITTKWQSSVLRSGDSSISSGFADGTLSNSEVLESASNTILDISDPELNGRYSESWNNVEIRSYNRVYDPTTGHNRDLMIFTTHDEETFGQALNVIVDFENGDINNATGTLFPSNEPIESLEDIEIEFSTGGFEETDQWRSINGVFDPPPDMSTTAYEGSYFLRAEAQTYDLQNRIFLSLTFNKVSAGYITFRYRHDNRSYTTYPNVVSNVPIWQNRLDITLDNSVLRGDELINSNPRLKIDDTNLVTGSGGQDVNPGDPLVSRIDNINYPANFTNDETNLKGWHKIEIYAEAGTHTLRITQVREQLNEIGGIFLYSDIDKLELSNLMVGEDTTSRKRWIFNGEKIQKAEWWAWPRRDEESESDLTGRVSTAPDYITLDKMGRILYGNPHYVVRLIPNDDDPGYWKLDTTHGRDRGPGFGGNNDGGYLRFTASPGATRVESGESEPSCDDPDPDYEWADAIFDPPWGAFQILPFGTEGDYQVRGANASLRDATEIPFSEDNFPGEYFRSKLAVTAPGAWSTRAHSWTITQDGHHLRPHVEVLWRPPRFIESFPEDQGWPSDRYTSDFAYADGDSPNAIQFGYAALRPRDPRKLPFRSGKPRWTNYNVIISSTFCDTFTQEPQAVWKRIINTDPELENYDPDVSGPVNSAKWQLISSRFWPTSGQFCPTYYGADIGINFAIQGCEDDPSVFFTIGTNFYGSITVYSLTDFDAIDVDFPGCQ